MNLTTKMYLIFVLAIMVVVFVYRLVYGEPDEKHKKAYEDKVYDCNSFANTCHWSSYKFLVDTNNIIKPGKKYLFSFNWEEKDPFREVEVDTIKIIAIKGDYIQFAFTSGSYTTSASVRLFISCYRPLK